MAFAQAFPIRPARSQRVARPVFVDSVMTSEECSELVVASSSPWHASLVTPSVPLDSSVPVAGYRSGVVRSTDQADVAPTSYRLLRERVVARALQINEQDFGFDLTGVLPSDSFSLIRYDHRQAGHFAVHRDLGSAFSTRKLSLSLQLSASDEYVGGDLLFPFSNDRAPRAIGTLVVFPSFLSHTVTSVNAGVRYALVGWIHGPSFR